MSTQRMRAIPGGASGSGPTGGGPGGGGRRPPLSLAWMKNLTCEGKGYATTVHNLMLILSHEASWVMNGDKREPIICWDEFAQRLVFLRHPPFHEDYREQDTTIRHDPHAHTTRNLHPRFVGMEVNDAMITSTAAWIERKFEGKFRPKANMVLEAMETIARTNKRHPVREMLLQQTWDGKERLGRVPKKDDPDDKGAPSWLTTYLGAEDTPYTRKVGRWWLIAGIARVMKPGCQADYTIILEGNQGLGKSKTIRALFEPWFTDDLPDVRTKDAQQQLAGMWGVELGEMDATSRVPLSAVKRFMTQQSDRYRPPYGTLPRTFLRQNIFCGSTNKRAYLRDETGNRRWHPVWTTFADVDGVREYRNQIWAEALVAYNAGELWWPGKDDVEELKDQQEDRMEIDPWFDPVAGWLAGRDAQAEKYRREGQEAKAADLETVSTADVLSALNIDKARWTEVESKRVAKLMTQLGRERVRKLIAPGYRTFVYQKPAPAIPIPPPPRPNPGLFNFDDDESREGHG